MFCSNCGKQVNDNQKFCTECGAPLTAPQRREYVPEQPAEPVEKPEPAYVPPVQPTYIPSAEPEPEKKSKKGLVIGLVVGALVLLIAAALVVFVWHPWNRTSSAPVPNPAAPTKEAVLPGETPAPAEERSAAEVIRDAYARMNELQSMHLDFNQEVKMTIGIPSVDFSQEMLMTIRLEMDQQKNPDRAALTASIDSMGQKQDFRIYTEVLDGKNYSYTSLDDGRSWSKTEDSASALGFQNPSESIEVWMKHAKDFQKVGTQTFAGYQTTEYRGTLSGEFIKDVLGSSGNLVAGLGDADTDTILKDMDDIPISFFIDNDSGCLVRISLDMKAAMETLIDRVMKQQLGELASSFEIECKAESVLMECTMSQFNAVPEIVIPADVKGEGESQQVPAAQADSIVGSWALAGAENEESQQFVSMALAMGMTIDFTFNADGTGSAYMNMGGEEQNENFRYTLENGKIVIDGDGAEYRIEDGMLYLSFDDEKLIFKRK